MITLAYIPDEYVEQILNANYTEQKLYEEFVNVNERIHGNTSIWTKKDGNRMFLSGKRGRQLRSGTIDLKEARNLYSLDGARKI